jgi:hypothetical protein
MTMPPAGSWALKVVFLGALVRVLLPVARTVPVVAPERVMPPVLRFVEMGSNGLREADVVCLSSLFSLLFSSLLAELDGDGVGVGEGESEVAR